MTSSAGSPWSALQPKAETGADIFSESDGTGITVAILDTGVDPGAAGLSTCPDGRPKIIDIIDCTGSGDVDTTTKVAAIVGLDHLAVKGLSGRTIKLNPAWANPTGEWRLGLKRAYELYPGSLVARVKAERTKAWKARVHDAQVSLKMQQGAAGEAADAVKETEVLLEVLASLDGAHDDPGPLFDVVAWHDGASWCAVLDCAESGDLSFGTKPLRSYRLERQHSTFTQVDNLNYTVTLFEEGDVCSVCVDAGAHGTHVAGITAAYHQDAPEQNGVAPGAQIVSLKIGDSRLGSMETGPGLTRALIECVKHKVDVVNMSYGEASGLPNEGRFVELASEVVRTHGIVFVSSAGNNGPALTTVGAPGGTSSALIGVGAMVTPAMMEAQYSANRSSFVAATPLDMEGGIAYTWSSQGPTSDGDFGVSVTAPGGAIAPVPTWTLQRKQLMNGTSMSSPNACGAIALVLGAVKKHNNNNNQHPASTSSIQTWLEVNPHVLRRAIEATAKPMPAVQGQGSPSVLSQGHGVLQVAQAFEWLKAHAALPLSASTPSPAAASPTTTHTTSPLPPCEFRVSVGSPGGGGGTKKRLRGVHLRNLEATSKVSTHAVSVRPSFHVHTPRSELSGLDLKLKLKSSAPGWLSCPALLSLCAGGRDFSVVVDPTNLEPGVHCGAVSAFLQDDGGGVGEAVPAAGALFEVPVTVVKPLPPPWATTKTGTDASSSSETLFTRELKGSPGCIHRHFLTPPRGATWMEVSLADLREGAEEVADSSAHMMLVHCVQLLPNTPFRDQEAKQYLRLHPGQQAKPVSMALEPELTVEVTVAQFWSSCGEAPLSLSVNFRGVDVSPPGFSLLAGCTQSVRFSATLRNEDVAPSASLAHWRRPLNPTSANITALKARDVLPPTAATLSPPAAALAAAPPALAVGAPPPPSSSSSSSLPPPSASKQLFQLTLEYSYTADAANVEMKPSAPLLNGLLYDAQFDAQLFHVLDSKRKLYGSGDAWPDHVKLGPKGVYTLRFCVRHDSLAALKRLEGMLVYVERKLPSSVALACFPDRAQASSGPSDSPPSVGGGLLLKGTALGVCFGEPSRSKLPAGVEPGDVLVGALQCVRKARDSSHPRGWPVTYVVPPNPPAKQAAATSPSAVAAAAAAVAVKPGGKERLNGGEEGKEDKEQQEKEGELAKLAQAVFDLKVKTLGTLSAAGKDAAWAELCALLFFEVLEASTVATTDTTQRQQRALPLKQAKLAHADRERSAKPTGTTEDEQHATSASTKQRRAAVVAAADEVLSCLDAAALSSKLGLKVVDKDDASEAKERKELEAQRAALVDALARKARALLDLSRCAATTSAPACAPAGAAAAAAAAEGGGAVAAGGVGGDDAAALFKQFETTFKQLKQWEGEGVLAGSKAASLGRLAVASLQANNLTAGAGPKSKARHGSLLKYLDEALGEIAGDVKHAKLEAELLAAKTKALEDLGWGWAVEYHKAWATINNPATGALF